MRRPTRLTTIAGVLAGVLALAGCDSAIPTTPSPSPLAAPSSSAAGSPSTAASPRSSPGTVGVERSLLDILPEAVEGQPLRPDDETAAEIAMTDELAPDVEAIAVGLYVQPGTSSADDLAIVNVVRLRPGVFAEAWFHSWRSTYDQAACEIAGGVEPGSAVTAIGDHETHIGSCTGGVHTYHVHLSSPDRVVSITAAGERRFGQRVVEGLTE